MLIGISRLSYATNTTAIRLDYVAYVQNFRGALSLRILETMGACFFCISLSLIRYFSLSLSHYSLIFFLLLCLSHLLISASLLYFDRKNLYTGFLNPPYFFPSLTFSLTCFLHYFMWVFFQLTYVLVCRSLPIVNPGFL